MESLEELSEEGNEEFIKVVQLVLDFLTSTEQKGIPGPILVSGKGFPNW